MAAGSVPRSIRQARLNPTLHRGDAMREYLVAFPRRAHRTQTRPCSLNSRARLERSEQIQRARARQGFDRQHGARVLHHLLQLQRRSHAHTDEVFLVPAGGDRSRRCRRCQDAILSHQRRRRHLDHHESRLEAGATGEEPRKILVERGVDQTVDTTLGNPGESGQRDRQVIERERQRLAMKISTGDNFVADDQRIIGNRVELDLEHAARLGQRVPHRAVDLRSAA